jgi:two-component system, chemotaxis family, protein-glutamate methylesterase/glutaminase
MGRLRVLVVEDSQTVRARLVAALSSAHDIQVVGEAADGKAALELCQKLRPDVVTIDMVLPVMSGLAATEYIMAYCPTPILIVSASMNRGALFKTFEALDAGAVDVLEKPSGEESESSWNTRFVEAVRMVARIKVITHPRRRLEPPSANSQSARDSAAPMLNGHASSDYAVVAIGASTGGPGAVREILQSLPRNFRLPILLVLHLDATFTKGFIEWLNGESAVPVAAAEDGMALPSVGNPGVWVAPPDLHLTLARGRLRLTRDAERHSCRPSVDVLFESLARELGPKVVACLLTGMGRDGAKGLLDIHAYGGLTLAQDEQTSVVFGMPREAILLGAAKHVLPLDSFASTLVRVAGEEKA